MKIGEWLGYYLKSRVNIILSLSCLAVITTSIVVLRDVLRIIAPLAGFFLYLAVTGLVLFSRRGAREIVEVKEAEQIQKILDTIGRYEALRERITVLRLGDAEVKKAVEYLLLISGTYLEKCRELKTYSPAANSAIEEAEAVLKLYLEELDESSTERRYAVKDKDDFTDYKEKTLVQISALAETIKQKITEELEGLSRRERFKIMKEMQD